MSDDALASTREQQARLPEPQVLYDLFGRRRHEAETSHRGVATWLCEIALA